MATLLSQRRDVGERFLLEEVVEVVGDCGHGTVSFTRIGLVYDTNIHAGRTDSETDCFRRRGTGATRERRIATTQMTADGL